MRQNRKPARIEAPLSQVRLRAANDNPRPNQLDELVARHPHCAMLMAFGLAVIVGALLAAAAISIFGRVSDHREMGLHSFTPGSHQAPQKGTRMNPNMLISMVGDDRLELSTR